MILIAFILCFFLFNEAQFSFGKTAFLGDQVDQLAQFDLLLQFKTQALYGPFWSGTQPPVFGAGPIGALLMGTPLRLGFGVVGAQALFASLMLLSLLMFYVSLKKTSNSLFSFVVFLFLALSMNFRWILGVFWVNQLLAIFTAMFFYCYLKYLKRPSWDLFFSALAFIVLGFHVHSTAIVLIPFIFHMWKKFGKQSSYKFGLMFFLFSIIPFAIGEIVSNFSNSKNIIKYVLKDKESSSIHTRDILTQYWSGGYDGIYGTWESPQKFSFCVASFILVITGYLFYRRYKYANKILSEVTFYAILSLIVGGVFFAIMGRMLQGRHYLLTSLPSFAIVIATACLGIQTLIPRFLRGGIMFICVALFATLSFKTESPKEISVWNLENISFALKKICNEYPKIPSFEDSAFLTYIAEGGTVLSYVSSHFVPHCDYNSRYFETILVPRRDGLFPQSLVLENGKKNYLLIRVESPGIGIYRLSNTL